MSVTNELLTKDDWLDILRFPNQIVHPVLWAIAKDKPLRIALAELHASAHKIKFPNPYLPYLLEFGNLWVCLLGLYYDPWHDRRPDEAGKIYPLSRYETPIFFTGVLTPKK